MTPQKWLLLLAIEARELTARQRQQIVAQTRRTEQVIGRKFRNAMRKFFVGQARRVTKGYMDAGGYLSAHADGEYKDPASQLLGVNEDQAIVAASRPYVLEMTVAAINAASDLVGAPRVAAAKALKEPDILGTDPTVLFLTDQSAQRVVQVNDATRRGVQRTIVKGAAAGYSDYEIAYGSTRTRKDGFRPLKGMVERLYHGRPECIARTELAYSNNGASLHRYSQWGQDMVEVSDGPGCALTHHVQGLRPGESSSDDINGQKIAVKEANNWQVAHPNCRRVFLPLRQVRKPTTPPMEREAFITRPLTAAQRARVARDMAATRVTAPPKPPAPQVIAPIEPPPTATVYERAAEIRANESMTTLDDALALGKELEEEWQKEYKRRIGDLSRARLQAMGRSLRADEARKEAFAAYRANSDGRRWAVYEKAREEADAARKVFKKAQAAEAAVVNETTKAVLQRTREMGRGTGAAREASTVPVRGRTIKENKAAFEWAQDQLPRDWLIRMQQKRNGGQVKLTTAPAAIEHRGYYSDIADVIATPGKQTKTKKWATQAHNQEVSLHELVHRVQHSAHRSGAADITSFDRLNDITEELYKQRTTSPQGVRSSLKNKAGYEDREVFRDGFPPWPHEYMGKDYGDIMVYGNETAAVRQRTNRMASEVLTMGVQAILGPGSTGDFEFESAAKALRQDKQLMQFFLGVLAGI